MYIIRRYLYPTPPTPVRGGGLPIEILKFTTPTQVPIYNISTRSGIFVCSWLSVMGFVIFPSHFSPPRRKVYIYRWALLLMICKPSVHSGHNENVIKNQRPIRRRAPQSFFTVPVKITPDKSHTGTYNEIYDIILIHKSYIICGISTWLCQYTKKLKKYVWELMTHELIITKYAWKNWKIICI